ncbi:MAG: hypothetical protein HRF50_12870 [Phycisphaerae bacterium]|jgi:hypothetical protein
MLAIAIAAAMQLSAAATAGARVEPPPAVPPARPEPAAALPGERTPAPPADGEIVIERFAHCAQDVDAFPQGARWYVYQPAGADPAGVGAWIRYDICVPAALLPGNPTLTYPNLVGAERGDLYRGARLGWTDADENVGVTIGGTFLTCSTGQLVATEDDRLEFAIPAGLTPNRYRIWTFDPGTQPRSVVRVTQLDADGVPLPNSALDLPSSHDGAPSGCFASGWVPVMSGCAALRMQAVPGSGTSECRLIGLDWIDTNSPTFPGDEILLHGQPRCGALLHDGNDGDTKVVMPLSSINHVIASRPTQEFAVYWDTDATWDGDDAEMGPAKSIGGLSHQGIDGGSLHIATQRGDLPPEDWTASFPGGASRADYAEFRLVNGNAHLRSDRTGGVLGSVEAALLFDLSGLRVHNRVTIAPGVTAYVFFQYVALPTAPLDVDWVRFENDDAGKPVAGAGSVYADRKCDGLLLVGGASRVVYRLMQWLGHNRAADPALHPRVAYSPGGYYKLYMTQRADAVSAGDRLDAGETIECGYTLRIVDESRTAYGSALRPASSQER